MKKSYFDKIVKGGYCSGCGVCAYLFPGVFSMKLNELGMFQPELISNNENEINQLGDICPFSDKAKNEDSLAPKFLDNDIKLKSEVLGFYFSNFAGFVKRDNYREKGSSGGFVTWLLTKLFEQKIIDGVIHVGDFEKGDFKEPLMGYKISFTTDEIRKNSKSRYYPIELSGVLNELKKNHKGKKFAFVGVPCFIKAIRLLQESNQEIKNQIPFVIGIVCGHLKSTGFAKSFAWQSGIDPLKIKSIDFRFKKGGSKANEYFIKVKGIDFSGNEIEVIRQNKSFFGYLWGHGFFKYNACDFCDDIFAETADISFGDAWLPEFLSDGKGTNLIIVRNKILQKIILDNKGDLSIDEISIEKTISSQEAGVRHRRDGLKYRLFLKKRRGEWFPPKRVTPAKSHLDVRYQKIFRLRQRLTRASHVYFQEALEKSDFSIFQRFMEKELLYYNRLYNEKKVGFLNILKRLALSFFQKLKMILNGN